MSLSFGLYAFKHTVRSCVSNVSSTVTLLEIYFDFVLPPDELSSLDLVLDPAVPPVSVTVASS